MPAPDPDAEWWTLDDIAAYVGVRPDTLSSYVTRGQMPAPEHRFTRTPVWRPATIRAWYEQRPGRGRRKKDGQA